MSRKAPVSQFLLNRTRLLIDLAQAGNQYAQSELKERMVKHDQQMPGVLYILMLESLEEVYPDE